MATAEYVMTFKVKFSQKTYDFDNESRIPPFSVKMKNILKIGQSHSLTKFILSPRIVYMFHVLLRYRTPHP